ncbi:hypothetical protein DID77_00845 [Candidatus Marinamargulisbacteria bacterium SCGC AG-439-L15]|nr:hypothetical protein DID77_00845 [Candidatus Marinamargulisbacteria bacterium SCGC AG-439-L15]
MNVPFPRLKKILILSNGYGEDQIACHLIRALWEHDPSIEVVVMPLVGEGKEYRSLSLLPVCKNKQMPSGGFIRNPLHFFRDLGAGVLGNHLSQMRQMRSVTEDVDFTIAVGDVFCCVMASRHNAGPVFFLPTAKSDFFMPHTRLEKKLIKRIATQVYPRDQLTSDSLKASGINSIYLGNPMMDHLQFSDEMFGVKEGAFVVGLLPGSRKEGYSNLVLLLNLIDKMALLGGDYEYILAKAKTLDLSVLRKQLKSTSWKLVYKDPYLRLLNTRTGKTVILTGQFPDVLKVSQVVIGLAGTANEQAVYMGKTVLCFKGSGPQSSRKRFKEQEKLLGDALRFVDEQDTSRLAKRLYEMIQGVSYQSPMTPQLPNASEAIIASIVGL